MDIFIIMKGKHVQITCTGSRSVDAKHRLVNGFALFNPPDELEIDFW